MCANLTLQAIWNSKQKSIVNYLWSLCSPVHGMERMEQKTKQQPTYEFIRMFYLIKAFQFAAFNAVCWKSGVAPSGVGGWFDGNTAASNNQQNTKHTALHSNGLVNREQWNNSNDEWHSIQKISNFVALLLLWSRGEEIINFPVKYSINELIYNNYVYVWVLVLIAA